MPALTAPGSIWINAAIFTISGALVWFAGTRLARYVDAIGERTGIAREFLGMLLLGAVTSLPELAVATTGPVVCAGGTSSVASISAS